VWEESTPEGRPWTWLWGEINPQRPAAEKAGEGVRNAEVGKVAGSGIPVAQRTPRADVAKRGSQPQGRCSTPGGVGRARNGRTLKGSKAYGRMNLFAQASRGRRTVETASFDGNAESKAGVGNPWVPRAGRISTLRKADDLMRGSTVGGDTGGAPVRV
jgi:hypothetical protein